MKSSKEPTRTNTELQKKHEKFYSIFDNVSEYVMFIDKEFIVKYINKNFGQTLNTQSTNTKCFKLLYNKDSICEFCKIQKPGNNTENTENQQFQQISAQELDENTIVSIYKHTQHEKEYTTLLNRQKILMDQSPVSVIITDIEGDIIFANKKAEKISGYKAEELIGKNPRIFKTEHTPKSTHEEMWKTVTQGNTWEGEFINKRKNGELFYEYALITPLKDENNKIKNFIALKSDITKRKNAEIKLKQSQEKYKAVFDSNTIPIILTNLSTNKIEEVSPGAVKFYKFPKEELFKISVFDLDAKHTKQEIDQILEDIKNEKTHKIITKHKTAKDETINVNLFNKIQKFNNEEYLLSIITDLSEKKVFEEQIAESEEKFKAAFFINPDSICINTMSGTFINVNNGFENKTGYSEKEVLGKKFNEIQILEKNNDLKYFIEKITEEGEVNDLETTFLSKNGEKLTGLISAKIIYLKNKAHILSITKDITERKINTQKIENKNNELIKLNNKLLVATQRAHESDKLKSAFLANMSHEIRTSMNGIVGFAKLLSSPNLKPEKHKEFTEIIIKSSNQLLSIVNDILDISKIETGQMEMHYTNFDICELISEIIRFFEPAAENKNIKLTSNIHKNCQEVLINHDRTKIRQIIDNLINNSIKFTEKGSVNIACKISENKLLIKISDTGIGMNNEEINFIFDRFRKVSKKYFSGTGLGLAISKGLIEKMNGSIAVESIEAQGSTFSITIPFEKGSNNKEKANNNNNSNNNKAQKVKILIAEDEFYNFL